MFDPIIVDIGSINEAPILQFDFSPVAPKPKLLLPLIPRKDLESIGIYYRVPFLLSERMCSHSKAIFDVALNDLANGRLPTSSAVRIYVSIYSEKPCRTTEWQDEAWRERGFNAFDKTLGVVPQSLMTPQCPRPWRIMTEL